MRRVDQFEGAGGGDRGGGQVLQVVTDAGGVVGRSDRGEVAVGPDDGDGAAVPQRRRDERDEVAVRPQIDPVGRACRTVGHDKRMPAAAEHRVQGVARPVRGVDREVGHPLTGPRQAGDSAGAGERAAGVAHDGLGHAARQAPLHRRQPQRRQAGIPQRPLERPGRRPELDQALGEPEHLRGHWAAFLPVAVQQIFRSPASDDQGEFPAEVGRVQHPGVHALPAGRRVDVHRVTGQQHPALAVYGGGPELAAEAGQGFRVGDHHRPGTALGHQGLDFVERGRPATPVARHGQRQPPEVRGDRDARQREAVGPHESVDLVRAAGPVQVRIGQEPVPRVGLAEERELERVPHPAVRAVAADQETGADLLLAPRRVPQRRRDRIAVVGEANQLHADLDRAAELGDPVAQQRLRVVLGEVELEPER
jgi:hypothetical protein